MDVNGLRFWMLANADDWDLDPDVSYDAATRRLQLASQRPVPTLPDDTPPGLRGNAEARLQRIPQTRDTYGNRAYWDQTSERIVATGTLPDSVPIFQLPGNTPPTDMAVGFDGVLYIAHEGSVILFDLRERWEARQLVLENFTAWRLATCASGGAFVLDRDNNQLAYITGLPLPDRPNDYAPTTVRPCDEDPDPPRMTLLPDAVWTPDETPVAIACSPEDRVALLLWDADGNAVLRTLNADGTLSNGQMLLGARFPYSLAWLDDLHVALLMIELPRESLAYPVDYPESDIPPTGEFYPLVEHSGGPFLNSLELPPHYRTLAGSKPLHRLSVAYYATAGTATNHYTLDSQDMQTVWHRLYLEAIIPPNCGVVVELAATATPGIPETGWYPHDFGEITSSPHAPHAAWESQFSEVPFHPGFLDCDLVPGRKGLFTVLIQRAPHVVKRLRGRYLHARVHLFGDGRSTPEVAALRAYGPRFSYVEQYLPALYHETRFGADADALATADEHSTQADFLERFVDIFEGVLTPLEGQIAASYLLTDPRSTPDDSLEWLGMWLGVTFDAEMPPSIRRDLLQQTPQLYQRWGTFDGLRLALDILTRGGVTSGEIVVLEDYRLRRTFATILGADLADEDDPLLSGIVRSGNSFVGDTLILGEEWRKEFLALYAADLPTTAAEDDAIERLFDELAHRATVIVHQDMSPLDVRLIRRVVNVAAPAHVLVQVLTSTTQFIVGMAALIGVDTYPGTHPERQPVRVNRSQIGVRDYIQALPSLDPRLESGRRQTGAIETEPPVARLRGPEENVELGDDITLDGSESSAAPGRSLTGFNWTQRDD